MRAWRDANRATSRRRRRGRGLTRRSGALENGEMGATMRYDNYITLHICT